MSTIVSLSVGYENTSRGIQHGLKMPPTKVGGGEQEAPVLKRFKTVTVLLDKSVGYLDIAQHQKDTLQFLISQK